MRSTLHPCAPPCIQEDPAGRSTCACSCTPREDPAGRSTCACTPREDPGAPHALAHRGRTRALHTCACSGRSSGCPWIHAIHALHPGAVRVLFPEFARAVILLHVYLQLHPCAPPSTHAPPLGPCAPPFVAHALHPRSMRSTLHPCASPSTHALHPQPMRSTLHSCAPPSIHALHPASMRSPLGPCAPPSIHALHPASMRSNPKRRRLLQKRGVKAKARDSDWPARLSVSVSSVSFT